MSEFIFKPMQQSDLPLLFRWVQQPHVQKWWGAENIWEEIQVRYMTNIKSEDCFPHIVFFESNPFGYINYWTTESDPDFRDLFPSGSVGTDQFIGVPEKLDQGHGSKLVKAFTDLLLEKPNIPVD